MITEYSTTKQSIAALTTKCPTTEQSIAALTDALRLTVPLHIRELEARLDTLPKSFDREGVLISVAARCAREYAPRGDMLAFAPRASRHYTAAHQAGLSLSRGIAAACLLNPEVGVEVFGVHFCARPHEGCPLPSPELVRPGREHLDAFHAVLDDFEALQREAA